MDAGCENWRKFPSSKYGNVLEITVRLPWSDIERPPIPAYEPISYTPTPTQTLQIHP